MPEPLAAGGSVGGGRLSAPSTRRQRPPQLHRSREPAAAAGAAGAQASTVLVPIAPSILDASSAAWQRSLGGAASGPAPPPRRATDAGRRAGASTAAAVAAPLPAALVDRDLADEGGGFAVLPLAPASDGTATLELDDERSGMVDPLGRPARHLAGGTGAAVANALARVAAQRQPGGEAAEQLGALLAEARARFGQMDLSALALVVASVVQLGHAPSQAWWADWDRACAAQIPGGSPRTLLQAAQALGRLRRRPSDAWLAAALAHVAATSRDRLSVARAASWLAALSRLGRPLPPAWTLQLLAAAAPRLADAPPPEALSRLLWALSKLQAPDPPAQWLTAYGDAVQRALPAYTPAQMAVSLSALASWTSAPAALRALAGAPAPRPGAAAAAAAAAAHGAPALGSCSLGAPPAAPARTEGGGGGGGDGMVASMVAQLAQRVSATSPADVCAVLGSLAKLQHTPPSAALHALLASAQGQLPRLSPQQLATLTWAVAKLGAAPGAAFMGALALEARAQLVSMNGEALSNVLWALGRLAWQPDEGFRRDLWVELSGRSQPLRPHELSASLWGLARMQLVPPSDWVRAQLRACPPSLSAGWQPCELASAVWGLGALGPGTAPPAELDKWLARLECSTLHLLGSFPLDCLVNLLRGFGALGYSPGSTWQRACAGELRARCESCGLLGGVDGCGPHGADSVQELLQEAGLGHVLVAAEQLPPER